VPLCPLQTVALTEIGFSDHSPMMGDDFDAWRMRLGQLDGYVEKDRSVQRDFHNLRHASASRWITCPTTKTGSATLLARHPRDYLIGSVHYLTGNWAVDHQGNLADWETHDVWVQAARGGPDAIMSHPSQHRRRYVERGPGSPDRSRPFPHPRKVFGVGDEMLQPEMQLIQIVSPHRSSRL
jgi:hypothetical protein